MWNPVYLNCQKQMKKYHTFRNEIRLQRREPQRRRKIEDHVLGISTEFPEKYSREILRNLLKQSL